MAIALGQVAGAQGTASSASQTTSSVDTAASGSTFVVFVMSYNQGSTHDVTGVTDNKGNGNYTLIRQDDGFSNIDCSIWYKENGAGGSGHTFTASYSNSQKTVIAIEITGGLTSGIKDLDVAFAGDATSPYLSPTTGTTNQADEMVVACYATATSSGTETLDWSANGYTQALAYGDANYITGGVGYKVVSATGTQQCSITSSGGGTIDTFSAVVTFKAAAGGGGGSGFRVAFARHANQSIG